MMVVPESMIVSNLLTTALVPTYAEAPPICQKPFEVERSWYSMSPV